ncbi:MAG: transporter substrate-binding domain-containing protein [Pseudomonadota bacterium]
MNQAVMQEIAATGVLRVGINLGNMLLVTDREADGTPVGVAPDMARSLADHLGVGLSLIPFPRVGQVADAISGPDIDIGLIAEEPERAQTIAFSEAYVEIEATYLVREETGIATVEDVDRPGIKVAVADRAAYDLYLKRTLKNAELVRAGGLDGAFELFQNEHLPVLAGLRPALRSNASKAPGTRVLPDRYTSIQQAIGTKPGYVNARSYINEFIRDAKDSGRVAQLLDRHRVAESLSVAP